MDENKVWTLMARKLAGEISSEELQELLNFLQQNPDYKATYQKISKYWDQQASPAEQNEAYDRLVRKLNASLEADTTKRAESYIWAGQKSNTVKIFSMFTSYFKIARRNISKSKMYSAINIGGLALGMAVAMLIGLWVYDELSFNRYHKNYDRIAQVKVNALYDGQVYTIESNPIPLSKELRNSFGSDFTYVVASTSASPHILTTGNQSFTSTGRFMEPDAPAMLSLQFLNGSGKNLQDQRSILIASSLSKKLFGSNDALDKSLVIANTVEVKVGGVYEDLPANTQFKDVLFIAPFDLFLQSSEWAKNAENDWSNQLVQVFVQIAPKANFNQLSAKIRDVKLNHVSGEQAARKPALFLHPMNQWQLYSKFENGVTVTSDQLKLVWFYALIGIFVLFLACINFMNLSTARSEKRSKEVGIRKTLGSLRLQLVKQFFAESTLVAAYSFILCVLLVWLILPWFNTVTSKDISITWNKPLFWLTSIGFTLFTGLLAGIYPALYLSSFNAVKVLRGTFHAGSLAALPRKVLVVLQFTISMALIIATIVIYRQVEFGQQRPIGYSRDGLVSLDMATAGFQDKFELVRNELMNTGVVTGVTETSGPMTSIWSTNNDFDWAGKPQGLKPDFGTIGVTHDFGKTIGWKIQDGRDFSRQFGSDSASVILNEAALKITGIRDPVGKTLQHSGKYYTIIGIAKDMIMESPFKPAYPTIFFIGGDMNTILVRINENASAKNGIEKIEAVFKRLFPASPLNYQFVDEEYASKFASEQRISSLVSFFAVLAIIISCLGLFGLTSFVVEQRTKEIGIRKVLGASLFSIWRLLSKDFVVLVLISLLIATPIAYITMSNWLQNYEYRILLSWWIFVAAGAGVLLIALITVSLQAIRVALVQPAKSLRPE